MTTDLENEDIIHQVVGELEKKFSDRPADEIESVVREEFAVLADRPVRDYVLILTERAAKKRLKHDSKKQG
jgi:Mg2+/Co2+ transporter CorC